MAIVNVTERGSSSVPIANYLASGKKGNQQHRVEYAESRNMIWDSDGATFYQPSLDPVPPFEKPQSVRIVDDKAGTGSRALEADKSEANVREMTLAEIPSAPTASEENAMLQWVDESDGGTVPIEMSELAIDLNDTDEVAAWKLDHRNRITREQLTERAKQPERQSMTPEQIKQAGFIMNDTASLSNRVEKHSYHFSMSFAPEDNATREMMIASADRMLMAGDLTEHEAVIVIHNDTGDEVKGTGNGFKHLHVMVNRVKPMIDPKDPEKLTGRANPMANDYVKLEREARAIEEEFNLRHVPGPHTGKEPDRRGIYHAPTRIEMEKAAKNNTPLAFRMTKERCRKLREEVAPIFDASSGWPGFKRRLKSLGYDLQPVGKGLRVVRGMSYAKFSDLTPPKVNVKLLVRKWGPFEFEKEDEDVPRPKPPKPDKQALAPKRKAPPTIQPPVQEEEDDDAIAQRRPGQSRSAWLEEQRARELKRKRRRIDRDKEKDDDEPEI